MLRTGKQHLESLRDGRVIYIGDERVDPGLELRVAVLGEDAPLIGAATLIDTPEDTILH